MIQHWPLRCLNTVTVMSRHLVWIKRNDSSPGGMAWHSTVFHHAIQNHAQCISHTFFLDFWDSLDSSFSQYITMSDWNYGMYSLTVKSSRTKLKQFFKKIYLGGKRERRKGEIESQALICWPIPPQMFATTGNRPGWSQETDTTFRSPMWWATSDLNPHHSFQGQYWQEPGIRSQNQELNHEIDAGHRS